MGKTIFLSLVAIFVFPGQGNGQGRRLSEKKLVERGQKVVDTTLSRVTRELEDFKREKFARGRYSSRPQNLVVRNAEFVERGILSQASLLKGGDRLELLDRYDEIDFVRLEGGLIPGMDVPVAFSSKDPPGEAKRIRDTLNPDMYVRNLNTNGHDLVEMFRQHYRSLSDNALQQEAAKRYDLSRDTDQNRTALSVTVRAKAAMLFPRETSPLWFSSKVEGAVAKFSDALGEVAYRSRLERNLRLASLAFEILEHERGSEWAKIRLKMASNRLATLNLPDRTLALDVSKDGVLHAWATRGRLDEISPLSMELLRLLGQNDFFETVLLSADASALLGEKYDLTSLFPSKWIVHDPSLEEATETLLRLSDPGLDKSFAVINALPANEEQKMAMRLNWSEADRLDAWHGARNFVSTLRSDGLLERNVDWSDGIVRKMWQWFSGSTPSESAVHTLRNSSNILIIYAHGDHKGILLPDGSELSVDDVEAIKFPKNNGPVVLLFSCEGGRSAGGDGTPSLAAALKKSGARAVLSFEDKVDARNAVGVANHFVRLLPERTLFEAIRKVFIDHSENEGRPRMRFKAEVPSSFNRIPGEDELGEGARRVNMQGRTHL